MNSYAWSRISKDEGTLLRAFAILAIVFHNYLHWISDSPGENEFNYRPERVQALLHGLWNTPWDGFRLLATYFGHYGVQVFFFLSAYGLTIKYRDQQPRWFEFQKKRWRAIFPAIFVAAIGYLIYESLRLDIQHVITTEGINLIRQMLGVSNFIPDNIYHPIGPWWFIGVILQFYLLIPFLLQGTRRHSTKFLCLLATSSMALELFLGPLLAHQFDFNLNHSVLGHLDVFAMGIWFARNKKVTIPNWCIALAGALFAISNFNATLWITTGVTSLVLALPLLRKVSAHIQKHPTLNHGLMSIGQLSLFIFLCNGYLRRPLIEWAQQSPHWWTSIWTSFLFLAIVILWSLVLRSATTKLTRNAFKD